MIKNVYSGRPWESKAAYCRAKRVGNIIVVSGTVAVNEAGDVIAAVEVARLIRPELLVEVEADALVLK